MRAGIALACAATLSSTGFALELGDITLSSMLNEPLSASIALESLDGAEAADLSVTLGDESAYEEAGIERDAVLDDIRISVEVDSASDGRIVLSSTSPVVEPFLNLIVSVSEPDGTSAQKEYTLLLELPTNTAAPQSTATAPQTATAPAAAGNAQSYTVGAGDTLWEVALSTRPDASVSVQQMMLAIQRANPDAFLNGNINNLLNGRVLRIPSQQDIAVIDRDAAVAQVSQQNTGLGGQPLAAGNGGAAARGADSRDQLRVLSGDAAGQAANGGDDLAATIAALENELMISEENLDRARLENLELNNRLAALQEQIDLLENIIAMEDDRIATLQAELAQQAEATAQALAAAENAAAQIEELNNEPPAGVAGLLRNGIVLLVGLVLVVLAALGFLVNRRRQAQLAAEEGRFNPAFAEIDDAAVADDDADEKPGLFAGLLARFRRNRDADDIDDDYEADALVAESREPAAGAAAYAATQEATSGLRGERDGDDDMTSLDAALDGIDNEQAGPQADEVEPLVDAVPEDVAAAGADATDAVAAVDETQASDADYAVTAADAAFAAIDDEVEVAETIEFTMPAAEPEPLEAAASPAATDEGLAETFEFTLKDLPDTESPVPVAKAAHEAIETFDFRLSTPAPASEPAASAASEAAEPLEVIAFPGSTSAPAASPLLGDDLPLELGDLSFDDTTLLDDEEESPYKPRTGNECDTKLDLATAYEAMGDVVEAIEILDEVIAEGSPSQIETAQRLKDSWQASL